MSEEPGAAADGAAANLQPDGGATDTGGRQRRRQKGLAESRLRGCLALVVLALWVAGFASWYGAVAGRPMARLQWAGSVTAAGRLAKSILPRYWPALAATTAPVLGLAIGLAFACMLGLLVFWSSRGGWLARLGIAASIATLLLVLLEFGALAWALHDRLRSGWLLAASEGLAVSAASVLLLAAAIGLGALCAAIGRIVPRRQAWWEDTALRTAAGPDARPLVISPPPTMPGGGRRTGTLIFAQSVLTSDMPYEVLSFTQDDVSFPRDSTGDQWFNSAQFDAYQRLGYFIGQAASAAGNHGAAAAAGDQAASRGQLASGGQLAPGPGAAAAGHEEQLASLIPPQPTGG
jgi:hypothetical protein